MSLYRIDTPLRLDGKRRTDRVTAAELAAAGVDADEIAKLVFCGALVALDVSDAGKGGDANDKLEAGADDATPATPPAKATRAKKNAA